METPERATTVRETQPDRVKSGMPEFAAFQAAAVVRFSRLYDQTRPNTTNKIDDMTRVEGTGVADAGWTSTCMKNGLSRP